MLLRIDTSEFHKSGTKLKNLAFIWGFQAIGDPYLVRPPRDVVADLSLSRSFPLFPVNGAQPKSSLTGMRLLVV